MKNKNENKNYITEQRSGKDAPCDTPSGYTYTESTHLSAKS